MADGALTFMWTLILSIIGGVAMAAVILARVPDEGDDLDFSSLDLDAVERELNDEVRDLNKN